MKNHAGKERSRIRKIQDINKVELEIEAIE